MCDQRCRSCMGASLPSHPTTSRLGANASHDDSSMTDAGLTTDESREDGTLGRDEFECGVHVVEWHRASHNRSLRHGLVSSCDGAKDGARCLLDKYLATLLPVWLVHTILY